MFEFLVLRALEPLQESEYFDPFYKKINLTDIKKWISFRFILPILYILIVPYMICKKSHVLENDMLSTIIPLNDIIWTFDDWIQHNIWFSLMITSFQIEIAFMMLRYHIQNLKYYRGLNKICNMNYII